MNRPQRIGVPPAWKEKEERRLAQINTSAYREKSMSKKIVVPEGMLKAAIGQALESGKVMKRRLWTEFFGSHDATCVQFTREMLEAALEWLAEHPIVPTDEQFQKMCGFYDWIMRRDYEKMRDLIRKWTGMMFVAPEPEVMEAVKDLLVKNPDHPDREEIDKRILEAYRRGKEGK